MTVRKGEMNNIYRPQTKLRLCFHRGLSVHGGEREWWGCAWRGRVCVAGGAADATRYGQ